MTLYCLYLNGLYSIRLKVKYDIYHEKNKQYLKMEKIVIDFIFRWINFFIGAGILFSMKSDMVLKLHKWHSIFIHPRISNFVYYNSLNITCFLRKSMNTSLSSKLKENAMYSYRHLYQLLTMFMKTNELISLIPFK